MNWSYRTECNGGGGVLFESDRQAWDHANTFDFSIKLSCSDPFTCRWYAQRGWTPQRINNLLRKTMAWKSCFKFRYSSSLTWLGDCLDYVSQESGCRYELIHPVATIEINDGGRW